MTPEKRVATAMRDAQLVLSAYVEPGFHDPYKRSTSSSVSWATISSFRLWRRSRKDNLRKPDRSQKNLSDDFEARYWTKHLGVNRNKISRPSANSTNESVNSNVALVSTVSKAHVFQC